jgi:Sec-independent protein translocase protein TatA
MTEFLPQPDFYGTIGKIVCKSTLKRQDFSWKEPVMGFRLPELIALAAIVLALFGPKTLQSVARNVGKGVSQVKGAKDKIMAELPMEEIAKVTEGIPQVPLNPQQAVRMLLTPEQKESIKKDQAQPEKPVETKVDA